MNAIEKAIYDTSLQARKSPTPDNVNRWKHACDDVTRGRKTPYTVNRSLVNENLMEVFS